MKKIAFFLIISIAFSLSGYSQTKKESIKKLFALMKLDSTIERNMRVQLPVLLKMQGNKTPLAAAQDSVRSRMAPVLEIYKKMNEDMLEIYDKHFTEKEINSYIEFYKSPEGQKMVVLQPEIQKEMMEISMQKYKGDILKSIVEKSKPGNSKH